MRRANIFYCYIIALKDKFRKQAIMGNKHSCTFVILIKLKRDYFCPGIGH